MVYWVLGCKMLQAAVYDEGCATLSFWTNPSAVPSSHSKMEYFDGHVIFFGHAILMLSTSMMPTCRNLRTPFGHSSREGYLPFCAPGTNVIAVQPGCLL